MKKSFIITVLAWCMLIGLVGSSKKTVRSAQPAVPALYVEMSDRHLQIINGFYYYGQQLFSGILQDRYSNKQLYHETAFYNGREEGLALMYYPNGLLSEKRYYHQGEKDGVHTGWWQNGRLRFEYHFSAGLYDGDYREWYNSGQLYKQIHYTNGLDDEGKGWRESGKLFMNYTMRNGRRYGIVNSNLCYTVKNGRGEFEEKAEVTDDPSTVFSNDNKPR